MMYRRKRGEFKPESHVITYNIMNRIFCFLFFVFQPNFFSDRQDMSGNKKDDVLTAVVIADAYNNSFNPITPASPHCLQLLAGRPLLDYTLEWLLHNGLCEVILYLSSGPGLVKSWLTSSRWSQQSSCRALKITTIVNEDSASLGDACRDLDEKGVGGEFVPP